MRAVADNFASQPQRLKPQLFVGGIGTTEVVPYPIRQGNR